MKSRTSGAAMKNALARNVFPQRKLCHVVLFVAFMATVAGMSGPSFAQSYLTMTGTPSFSAPEPVEQGFVETANGNLHLEFLLGSFPQRGSKEPYRLRLIYDSHIWQIFSGNGSSWGKAGGNTTTGWTYSGVSLGSFVEADRAWLGCGADFTWTDPFATTHYFALPNIETVSSNPGQCPMTGDAFATDSSGYHLYYDYTGYTIKIYAPDGTIVRNAKISGYDTDAQGHIVIVKDPNGNYFSQTNDSQHTVFDTLGRIPIQGSICGTGGGPCYDIANSQADTGRSHCVVNYATVSVHTGFNQSGVTDYTGNLNVVQSIVLPDGSNYSFKYDCDSTLNSQACGSPHGQTAYYGVMKTMTLPTGGNVNYTYMNFSDSYGNKSRWMYIKTGPSGSWYYSPSVISTCGSTSVGCQQKVTVSKPSGDSSVYTFTLDNGAWLTQAQQYDNSGTLLSSTTNGWDFTRSCVLLGCHGHNFIRQTSQTHTVSLPGGTSLTKQTTFDYGNYWQQGNIVATRDWKYYPGTSPTFPSVPDRAKYVTYYSAGPNIINKPLTVTLCNNSGSDADCTGGGSKVSQTKITYDSYGTGLTTVSGIANHDDTNYGSGNLVRGNATQVQQWVSGSIFLATQNSFDTTGQMLTSTDPAGNPTTFTYTDNFFTNTGDSSMSAFAPPAPTNAYVKTITQGGLTTTFGYYFGSGKRAFTTDPNNTTTYHYFFDSQDRPKETIYPIGWSLTTYTSPNQVDTYIPVGDSSASSGCLSCQHRQINFDTWGRKANEKLINAPGAAINIDTTYDSSSRVASVSHAYVSTSDPSYVFETTAYDGLDRTTAISHPDGQRTKTFYGPAVMGFGANGLSAQQASATTYGYAYPVLTKDEAGKARQEWVDGFGRVIEIDEPTTASTAAQGTITVSGGERSTTWYPCGTGSCPTTAWDYGSFSVTINGFTVSPGYSQNSTAAGIASSIASGFNAPSSPVTALLSGTTITFTSKATGSNTNYAMSWSSATQYTQLFSGSSFSATASGSTLTGGSNSGSSFATPTVTSYLYNASGNLSQVVQGLQTRTFSYDGLGRLTSRTTPEAGTESLFYTNAANGLCAGESGAVCRRTDARAITTTYAYNARSQVTSKSYSNGQGAVTYQYDQGGSAAFAMGRRTSMTDPTGSETYSYNAMGWITQIQKTIGTTAFVTKYQYNAGGQVTQITYPSNRVVQHNLDNIGLLNSIVSGGTTYASIPEPPTGYNAALQLLTLTYGNGVNATFGYSPSRQQMTSLGYAKGAQILFSLNYFYQQDPTNCSTGPSANNGQIACIKDLVDVGRTEAFTYDALGRLTSAVTNGSTAYPQWGLSESYDRYGNRLSQTVTAGSGPSNSLSFATTSGGGAYTNRPDGYSFDASGNMLGDGINTLTYDAENRLITSAGSLGSGTYTYDGQGTRVKNVSGGTTTVTIYSGPDVIAEYVNGAAPTSPTNEYINMGDEKIAMIQSGTLYYFHHDHLSPRFRTDTAGSLRDARGTYPFGELWYSSPSPSWLFTSYHHDNESGNDYALARTYISRFGRFCSADPVMGNPNDPQSWNRYSYVRNDPVNSVDPSGQSFFSWLMRAFFAVISAFSGVPIYFPMPGMGTPPIIDNGPFGGTQIMLNSIYHPQDPSRFIINNWSPAAHDQMIRDALGPCGVGGDVIFKIQQASRDFDAKTQGPAQSYMHSMSNGKQVNADGTIGQSAEEALAQRNRFIENRMIAAQNAWSGGQTNNALEIFGQAIHPVMDSTSPWHTSYGDPYQGNPKPWCGDLGCKGSGSNVFGHYYGMASDPNFGESTAYLSAHPAHQQVANALIRSAFELMTGMHLNCRN